MSRNAETSTSIQDPASEATGSTRMSVAVIGPNAAHRKVVSKALAGSDARTVREFIDYPEKLSDVQRLMEQQRFDVVMIDVDSDQSYALQVVQKFAAFENVMVMVYSKRNDQALLRSCMEAGARDFLPLPGDPEVAPASTAPEPPQEAARTAPAAPAEIARTPAAPEIVRNAPVQLEPVLPAPAPAVESFYREAPAPVEPVRPAPALESFYREAPPALPEITRPQALPTPAPVPESFYREAPPVPEPVQSTPAFALEDFYRDPSAAREAMRVVEPVAKAVVPMPAPSHPQTEKRPASQEQEYSFMAKAAEVAPPPPPAAAEAKASQPASTDFAAWDNAWIRSAQPSNGAEPKLRPVEVPAPAKPAGRLIGGPQKVARPAAPVETSSTEAPLFRDMESSQGEAQGIDWKKWGLIGAIPVVLIVVLSLIFMRPSHPAAAPAAPATEVVTPQADPAEPSSASSTPAQPIAKPSPSAITNQTAGAMPTPAAPVSSEMMNAQLSAPTRISGSMKKPSPVEEAPPTGFTPGGLDASGSVPGAVFGSQNNLKVVPGVSAISAGVAAGMLLHRIEPIYPQFARDAHLGGTVLLGANITPAGTIEGLHVISGPDIFRGPAMEAVKNWRYRPYKLNNQPVEVQTTIRVIFSVDQQH